MEISKQKTLQPSMIIAYITHSFFEVFHVYLCFLGGQKGKSPNAWSVRLNVIYTHIYIYIFFFNFDRISFLNVFPGILRCFELKDILHGFVHFAWIVACFFFTWTLFSKLIKGSPTSIVFWATSMLSHLLPDTPSPIIFLGKLIEKNLLPRSGVPPINFLRYK